MKTLIITLLTVCAGTISKEPVKEQNIVQVKQAPTLTKVWETDSSLTTCESVLYDKKSKEIYVSNIDGEPGGKDGKGFISTINSDGSIKKLRWVDGLSAPKGMAIMGGNLYVTDCDELVEIDIKNASVTKKYPVEGAKFLNDAATDGKKIYFSDSGAGKIHVFENGKVTTMLENQKGINGLAVDKKGVLFSLDGRGMIKHNGQTQEVLNSVVTGGDGLIILANNTFIASRWGGEIYSIVDGKEQLLLDTKAEKSNTADIEYLPEEKLILVPTFFKNKVTAYKLAY